MGFMKKKKKKKKIEKEKFKAKEEYFLHNGAILLEQQISLCQLSKSEPLRILSAEDIKLATNNYDPHLIVGCLFSTVYRGTLEDRTVAVKTPEGIEPTDDVVRYYLNQVSTKVQIHHKNLVNLVGCCLESQIPILVHEFMPNGTLFDHLHRNGDTCRPWISWPNRLRIAKDIGYGLCYMHCAASNPIVHRDVKSSSILLDNDFTAKLSNFGLSVAVKPGETSDLPVRGSYGYIDPEYLKIGRVTEKCDVYSFGVVIIELLTGMLATEAIGDDGVWLAEHFVSIVEANEMLRLVERRIVEEAASVEQIEAFAGLGLRCVREKGEERPSMKEVVQELGRIQRFHP